MPLGWIDFSKNERNKVLNALDLLTEPGTLDELGIAPIRDGYANIFFPGTSTIQTRAKYFFIVPYALKDLENSDESNPKRILEKLNNKERECAKKLLNNSNTVEGIIGNRTARRKSQDWVKRTPADIYWAGLHSYGIFTMSNISLTGYVRAMCAQKIQNVTSAKLGNRNDNAEENEADDKDAGRTKCIQFWKLPTYSKDWENNLSIGLTKKEGDFLKKQIIDSHPDSLMAFILKEHNTDVLNIKSISDLIAYPSLPEQIRKDLTDAYNFSEFLFVIRTIYNMIISDGKNETAESEWQTLRNELSKRANLDLDCIFKRLKIEKSVLLHQFLSKSKELMSKSNLDGMKEVIKHRESELKQSRAKTLHPGEFDSSLWYGGKRLDYRFGNAKVIIKDIFESENNHVESK